MGSNFMGPVALWVGWGRGPLGRRAVLLGLSVAGGRLPLASSVVGWGRSPIACLQTQVARLAETAAGEARVVGVDQSQVMIAFVP